MITGNRDTDIIVLTKLNDKNFLIFSKFGNKHINKLYKNENLWRDRLFKYYGKFYPEPGQSWKNLYLSLVYHLDEYQYRKDNLAIRVASYGGHLDVVKYLMSLPKQYGINPAAENNWAIRFANRNEHLSVVKYLSSLPKEYGVYL